MLMIITALSYIANINIIIPIKNIINAVNGTYDKGASNWNSLTL